MSSLKQCLLPLLAAIVFVSFQSHAAEVLRDFSLPDANPQSPRAGDSVSPRDYILQVSGYYFGRAN